MLGRAALLALLGAVCACDSPSQDKAPVQPPAAEPPAVVLSGQQIHERSEQCAKASRDEFRRAWGDKTAAAAGRQDGAEFVHRYNAKLDTCFYLLTIKQSAGTIRKMLVAINEREVYGEYRGPATSESPAAVFPATCRVLALYCASAREWEVLVSEFMED